ncbi:ESX secretion-associated protein EspG [Nocardia sp. NPDC052566]|uniref:ESX secretion-associated protein EspG n=1 Tax=Nocardia sp. NPDC052566 TaxID=3364330 RepID=UPI0037CB8C0C
MSGGHAGQERGTRFDDFEFAVRWEDSTGEFLPGPLIVTSRIASGFEYEAAKRRMRESLRSAPNAAADEMMRALVRPDLSVALCGGDPRDPDNPESVVRVYGARNDDRAYVVRQLPGETCWHASGFVVSEHDPSALPAALVAALPSVAAGRQSEIALSRGPVSDASDGMDYTVGRSDIRDSFEDSAVDRANAFQQLPTSMSGYVEFAQGWSAFGPRGLVHRAMGWRDVVDDGRYAIVGDLPTAVAKGVDAKAFQTLIAEEIEEVMLVIADERRSIPRG